MDSFVLQWQLLQCSCLRREPVPLFKPLPPTPIHGVGIKTLLTHLPSTVTDPEGPRRAGMAIPTCGGIAETRLSLGGAVLLCPLRHGGPVQGRKPWARPGWKVVCLSPKWFPLLPLPPLQTLTMNLLSRFIRSYACSSAYMGLCPLCAEPFRGVSDLQWPCEPLISEIAEAELQRRARVS